MSDQAQQPADGPGDASSDVQALVEGARIASARLWRSG